MAAFSRIKIAGMNPAPNLVLVGPMGAGKTSIGRRLAERLGLPFADADRGHRSCAPAPRVATIFECEGEAGFRARERAMLAELLHGDGLRDRHRRRRGARRRTIAGCCATRGFVVHLQVGVDGQLERLARDRTRPLLQRADREAVLRTLASERAPLYAEVADLRFDTDGLARERRGAAARRAAGRRTLATQRGRGMSARCARSRSAARSRIASRSAPACCDDGAALAAHVRGRHVLIVSDSHVAPLYARALADALQARAPAALRASSPACPPANRRRRSTASPNSMRELADFGATRDACVFALGGGVVGDLAGFAAACWMRGIDCVQLPTTLLAMVDSSVGGKTAVDLPQGKNLVGAFHPPRAVFADTATLRTLPERELRAGLAEVVKYGAIVDAAFLDWLDAHADALLARDDDALAEAIARSCAHKAAIVARDPFERGERALLNFGHTFAHAIESRTGLRRSATTARRSRSAWCCAARLSARAGPGDATPMRDAPARACWHASACRSRVPRGPGRPTRCSRACAWTRRPLPAACASSSGAARARPKSFRTWTNKR